MAVATFRRSIVRNGGIGALLAVEQADDRVGMMGKIEQQGHGHHTPQARTKPFAVCREVEQWRQHQRIGHCQDDGEQGKDLGWLADLAIGRQYACQHAPGPFSARVVDSQREDEDSRDGEGEQQGR